jgi:hypothetical protein
MPVARPFRILLAFLIPIAIASCGGGGGGSSSGGGSPTPLTVSPTAGYVVVNANLTLAASGGTAPYTYAVTTGSGSISTKGIYTAPATAGPVTATVTDAAGAHATSTITVADISHVAITPKSITMTAGSNETFTFTAVNGAGNYQFRVASGPGTITAGGVYTGGSQSGTATIEVTDRQSVTSSATVKSVFVRTNGPVYSATHDAASWYLGGSFTAVNAYQTPHLAVLNTTDGAPNLSCDLQDGFDDVVLTTASDGTAIYVGGKFSHYRGVETPGGLVKIDATTCEVISTYFLTTDQATSTTALFVSGGSLLVAANTLKYRNNIVVTGQTALFRVDATTGALDVNFRPTAFLASVPRLLATPTAVYAGFFKLDATTGAQDPAFQPPLFGGPVNAFALVGNTLYIGGSFGGSSGPVRKLNATTGAADPAFSPPIAFGTVYDLTLSGNALYVATSGYLAGSQWSGGLWKLDATTGAADPAFVTPGNFIGNPDEGGAHALLIDSGSLYVAGNFSLPGTAASFGLAKLNGATGALDTAFTKTVGLNDTGFTLLKVGSSLFTGGRFTTYRGNPASNFAKLGMTTGALEAPFTSTQLDGRVLAVAINNGAVYLGGEFLNYNGASAQYLAKVSLATGVLDTTFTQPSAGPNMPVKNIATTGTNLFVSGNFILYRGAVTYGLVKLNMTDGSLDPNYISGFTDQVGPLALNGQFLYTSSPTQTYANGNVHNPVFSRINTQSGALDVNFPGVPASTAFNMAVTLQQNIGYAAMPRFTSGGGNPVSNLIKFAGDTGTVDVGFAAPFDQIHQPVMALRSIGTSLYVAATPIQFGTGVDGYYLARLNATTGALDAAFPQPSSTVNGTIRALETTGTDLWVAGEFSQYRGAPAYYFVRVDPTTGAMSEP